MVCHEFSNSLTARRGAPPHSLFLSRFLSRLFLRFYSLPGFSHFTTKIYCCHIQFRLHFHRELSLDMCFVSRYVSAR